MENRELETKVLNINVDEIEAKLLSIGAKKIGNKNSRRKIFDIKSENIEFIRVREEGNVKTLTYKFKPLNNTVVGVTEEIEVKVDDFDKTLELIGKLKCFYRTMYQENKVILYEKDNVEYKIAMWPKIEPYLEIESNSEEKIDHALKELGLSGKDSGDFDVARIYEAMGIDLNSIEELKF